MAKKEFTHQLCDSFQYSHEGQFQQAEVLKITAPKITDFADNLQILDSLCNRAELRTLKNIAGVLKELDATDTQREQARKQAEEQTDDDKALSAYNQVVSGLDNAEIKMLNVCMKELLKKSAEVDGCHNFEDSFWDLLSIEDRRLLTGKYIENFTVTAQRNSKKA